MLLLFNTTRTTLVLLLFNTTRKRSGPPSTRATIAMDGGVADTARVLTLKPD